MFTPVHIKVFEMLLKFYQRKNCVVLRGLSDPVGTSSELLMDNPFQLCIAQKWTAQHTPSAIKKHTIKWGYRQLKKLLLHRHNSWCMATGLQVRFHYSTSKHSKEVKGHLYHRHLPAQFLCSSTHCPQLQSWGQKLQKQNNFLLKDKNYTYKS